MRWGMAALGGFSGTLGMSLLMLSAPLWGLPPMGIAMLLASVWNGREDLGWIAQFTFGTVLAFFYAGIFSSLLPGHPALRGILFGLGSWLMEQAVIFPVIGLGLFSGSTVLSLGSLAGHLVYGLIVGVMVPNSPRLQAECDKCQG